MFSPSIYTLGRYTQHISVLAPVIRVPSQRSLRVAASITGSHPSRKLSSKDRLQKYPENQSKELFQRMFQENIASLEVERNELRVKKNLFTQSDQTRLDQLNRQFCETELKETLKTLKERLAKISEKRVDLWKDNRILEDDISRLNEGLILIEAAYRSEQNQKVDRFPDNDLKRLLENPDEFLQESKRVQDIMDAELEIRSNPTKKEIEKRKLQIIENDDEVCVLGFEETVLELIHDVTEQNGLDFGFFDLPKNPVSNPESILALAELFNKPAMARGFFQALLNENLFKDNPEVFLKAWLKSSVPFKTAYRDVLIEHFQIPLPALGWLLRNNRENQEKILIWQSCPNASRLIRITERCKPLVTPFIQLVETIRMFWQMRKN